MTVFISICLPHPQPGNTLPFSAKIYPPQQGPALRVENIKKKKKSKEKEEEQRRGEDARGKQEGRVWNSRGKPEQSSENRENLHWVRSSIT